MAQAAARHTLRLTVGQPGVEYTVRCGDDNRFRWLRVVTNKQAILSETGIVPDGARRPLLAVIGPHDENEFVHSRWSVSRVRSFAEAPRWKLFWLFTHRESTPEFDDIRSYFPGY